MGEVQQDGGGLVWEKGRDGIKKNGRQSVVEMSVV